MQPWQSDAELATLELGLQVCKTTYSIYRWVFKPVFIGMMAVDPGVPWECRGVKTEVSKT